MEPSHDTMTVVNILLPVALGGILVIIGVWVGCRVSLGISPLPSKPKLFGKSSKKTPENEVTYPTVMSAREMERVESPEPDTSSIPPEEEEPPWNPQEI